jgi:hypothetical protein
MKVKNKYHLDFGRPNIGYTGPSEIWKVQLTKTLKLGQVSPHKNTKKIFDQFFT